jgi:hypothetical protein
MSVATWAAEFYPVDAEDCPVEQSVAHSRLKWSGLTQKSLDKHNCFISEGYVWSSRVASDCLGIGTGSCALCVNFRVDLDGKVGCDKCPFYVKHGRKCYSVRGSVRSEWKIWYDTQEAGPMIAALDVLEEHR